MCTCYSHPYASSDVVVSCYLLDQLLVTDLTMPFTFYEALDGSHALMWPDPSFLSGVPNMLLRADEL